MNYPGRLRKVVYDIDESMRNRFPAKLTGDDIEKEILYCQELVGVIKQRIVRFLGTRPIWP